MKLQFDHSKRVLALSNLHAMCKRISGTCHTFKVSDVTKHRVRVTYSNPDEYGSPEPITAVFPCYPAPDKSDSDNRAVVLDAIAYYGCTGHNSEAWQAFDQLYDCPTLWRSSAESDDWQTEYEILVSRHPEFTLKSRWPDPSLQVWFIETPTERREFTSWQQAQDYAVKAMRFIEQSTNS